MINMVSASEPNADLSVLISYTPYILNNSTDNKEIITRSNQVNYRVYRLNTTERFNCNAFQNNKLFNELAIQYLVLYNHASSNETQKDPNQNMIMFLINAHGSLTVIAGR